MAEKIRQCWAFHKDGTRCGHPAGHPGDHAVEMTWTDEECALPTEQHVQVPVQVPVPAAAPAPLEEKPVKCVACSHHHKGGACKCGCHEFIG